MAGQTNGFMAQVKGVAEAVGKLKQIEKKCREPIDKTVKDFKARGPAWVNQSVSEVYNIKKSEVKKDFKGPVKISKKGTVSDVGLKYSGYLRTLRAFGMRPTKPPTKKQKIVQRVMMKDGTFRMIHPLVPYDISFEIIKGRRRTIKADSKNPVFLSKIRGGEYVPMKRTGNNVQVLKSLSSAQMIANEQVQQKIYSTTNEQLSKRLEHHTERALSKI